MEENEKGGGENRGKGERKKKEYGDSKLQFEMTVLFGQN